MEAVTPVAIYDNKSSRSLHHLPFCFLSGSWSGLDYCTYRQPGKIRYTQEVFINKDSLTEVSVAVETIIVFTISSSQWHKCAGCWMLYQNLHKNLTPQCVFIHAQKQCTGTHAQWLWDGREIVQTVRKFLSVNNFFSLGWQ